MASLKAEVPDPPADSADTVDRGRPAPVDTSKGLPPPPGRLRRRLTVDGDSRSDGNVSTPRTVQMQQEDQAEAAAGAPGAAGAAGAGETAAAQAPAGRMRRRLTVDGEAPTLDGGWTPTGSGATRKTIAQTVADVAAEVAAEDAAAAAVDSASEMRDAANGDAADAAVVAVAGAADGPPPAVSPDAVDVIVDASNNEDAAGSGSAGGDPAAGPVAPAPAASPAPAGDDAGGRATATTNDAAPAAGADAVAMEEEEKEEKAGSGTKAAAAVSSSGGAPSALTPYAQGLLGVEPQAAAAAAAAGTAGTEAMVVDSAPTPASSSAAAAAAPASSKPPARAAPPAQPAPPAPPASPAPSGVLNTVITRYGGHTMIGEQYGVPKKANQDSMIMHEDPASKRVLLAVFDGHGYHGHHVSRHFRDQFPQCLFQTSGDYAAGQVDKAVSEELDRLEQDIIDADDVETDLSGTTAVLALVEGAVVTCYNVGDSRAVVGRAADPRLGLAGGLRAEDITRDHKPDDPDEKARILGRGGRVESRVFDDGYVGPARVYLQFAQVPGLAMSRSLCDTVAHEAGVVSKPEITRFTLAADVKIMILASDGLWEFMSSQVVMDLAHSLMQAGCGPEEIAVELQRAAKESWLKEEVVVDDTTIVVAFIDSAADDAPRAVDGVLDMAGPGDEEQQDEQLPDGAAEEKMNGADTGDSGSAGDIMMASAAPQGPGAVPDALANPAEVEEAVNSFTAYEPELI